MCLSRSKVCDGVPHCPDGEDEINCPGTCSSIRETHVSLHSGSNLKSKFVQTIKMVKCNGKLMDWRYACDGFKMECDSSCDSCYLQNAFDCYKKNSSSSNETSKRCIPRNMVSLFFLNRLKFLQDLIFFFLVLIETVLIISDLRRKRRLF